MNHQLISEISFKETVSVSSGDTARAVFGHLMYDTARSRDLVEPIATCYLVAAIESACVREMTRYIDPSTETVVARRVDIDHRRPIRPDTWLRLSGWVEVTDERGAVFFVRARDCRTVMVCEARIRLVAADSAMLAARLAERYEVLGRVKADSAAATPDKLTRSSTITLWAGRAGRAHS